MSYMQVVAYTHSGHSPSVLYGFACLFVIGFLWAALGGAGTALPAVADNTFLRPLFPPMGLVFLLWWLQGLVIEPWLRQQGYTLNWHDTDWLAATLALIAALVAAAVRRRLDGPTSLILHLAAGWWAGFLILVVVLGLRMTPPRGDNWAGCLGMTAGLFWFCRAAAVWRSSPDGARLWVHRRHRLRRGVDAEARRGHQRLPDQLAQHPGTDHGPFQRHWPGGCPRRTCGPAKGGKRRSGAGVVDRASGAGFCCAGDYLSQPSEERRALGR